MAIMRGMGRWLDFLPDYKIVSFFIGNKGGQNITVEQAFQVLCDCWNDYYDNVERLADYLKSLPEYCPNVRIGTMAEYFPFRISALKDDGERFLDLYDCPENRYENDFKQEVKRRFGVSLDYFFFWQHHYDAEMGKIIRMPWFGADTYEMTPGLAYKRDYGYKIYDMQMENSMEAVCNQNEQCQITIEVRDSVIPYDVYERMKKHCIETVY